MNKGNTMSKARELTIDDVVKFIAKEGFPFVHVVTPKCPKLLKRFGAASGVVGSYLKDFNPYGAWKPDRAMTFINDYKTYDKNNTIKTTFIYWTVKEDEFTVVSTKQFTPPTRKVPTLADKYEHSVAKRGEDIPEVLFDLLTHKTPFGSEDVVMDIVLASVKDSGATATVDTKKNVYVDIPMPDGEKSATVFSSHMDTVHRDPGEITLHITTGPKSDDADFVFATEDDKASILGADDKVGVYIMLEMIKSKVPGLYIFHVGEEHGCVGSRHIVSTTPKLVEGKKRIVAFDRMNYGDVIDTQRGSRCCSAVFATTLAARLNELVKTSSGGTLQDAKYEFSPSVGVVTDSAQYVDLIKECTNLSVGYFSQHTKDERFDLFWLTQFLIPSLKKLEWETLPTERDNTKKPLVHYNHNNYNHNRGYVVQFVGNRFDYRPEMPTNYNGLEAWSPIDGVPNETLNYKRTDIMRKWCWKTPYDQLKDIEKVLDHVADLEDTITEDINVMLTLQDSLAELEGELKECTKIADFKAFAVKLGGVFAEIYTEIMDTSSVFNYLEADDTTDEDEVIENEREIPTVLAEQNWTPKKGEPTIVVPEMTPNNMKIEFDVMSNILYVDGKVAELRSKKGAVIQDVHRLKLTHGTKLYAILGGEKHHVYTVDDEVFEKFADSIDHPLPN